MFLVHIEGNNKMKIKILGMAIVAVVISFASSASDEKMMILAGQEIFKKCSRK